MTVPMALDPAWRTHQLHVDLGDGTLDDMVGVLAQIAVDVLGPALSEPGERVRVRLEDALRTSLRRYIVGFDVCGLAALCTEAAPFDPWGGEVLP